jgi:hypothetical protein
MSRPAVPQPVLAPPTDSAVTMTQVLGEHTHSYNHPYHATPNSTITTITTTTTISKHDSQQGIKAANVAHFDALGDDFDKRHPEAAEFADRLSLALRRVLVLNEDATSVLDYACGSGEVTSRHPPTPLPLNHLHITAPLHPFLT